MFNKLENWYWAYGVQRTGNERLTRGSWLDEVYCICRDLEFVQRGLTQNKPTMALWGPSQSGKSTLLQEFIDGDSPQNEGCAALTWSPSAPARIYRGISDEQTAGHHNLSVLNPYNRRIADGSGCISRFTLRESVAHADFPAELEIASEADIMLYLAVGYLSETTAMREDGTRLFLSSAAVRALLPQAHGAVTEMDREAYQLLTRFCDVMDILVEMSNEYPRYTNLRPEWRNLRRDLLNNDYLISHREHVSGLIRTLLWDNWTSMNALYDALSCMRLRLQDLIGDRALYTSWAIASLLLDSEAVYHVAAGEVSFDVSSLGFEKRGEHMILRSGSERDAFLRQEGLVEDFAALQGLIALITIPLNSVAIRENNSVVHDLLVKADLLDFPGVSNAHAAAEKLTNEVLELNHRCDEQQVYWGYRQLLKRGKTAAIVMSSSHHLNIDVFSLFVRMPVGTHPAHPPQLLNGIESWYRAMEQPFPPKEGATLPTNLVLTFAAALIQDVVDHPLEQRDLHNNFEAVGTLGALSDRKYVNIFAANYPRGFTNATIKYGDRVLDQFLELPHLQEMMECMSVDTSFQKYFPSSDESFKAMLGLPYGDQGISDEYGGRMYFFNRVIEQLGQSPRYSLLSKKKNVLEARWNTLMRNSLPAEGENVMRERLEQLLYHLRPERDGMMRTDYCVDEIAKDIMSFVRIDPSIIESLPQTKEEQPRQEYIKRLLQAWRADASQKPLQQRLGFVDQADREKVLNYIEINAQLHPLEAWLRNICAEDGRRASVQEKEKRLVATYLIRCLFFNYGLQKNTSQEAVRMLNTLFEDGQANDIMRHPFYISVVKPFIDSMEQLERCGKHGTRPPCAGDDELYAIIRR